MKKEELLEIIKSEIKRVFIENGISEKLKVGHEGNLHGDERTQRQFVIDLASKNPMGIISLSDIAEALNTTRDAVQSYSRRMYLDSHRTNDDFVKIVDEVPFQNAAIYQLASRAKSAPLSKQMKDEILKQEERKYSDTTGVYYSIYTWSKNDRSPVNIGYLNLRDDEDIKKYKAMLPKSQNIYGDEYFYSISDKKINRLPENLKDKILSPDNFEKFIEDEFDNK